jgi:hypothetical protein
VKAQEHDPAFPFVKDTRTTRQQQPVVCGRQRSGVTRRFDDLVGRFGHTLASTLRLQGALDVFALHSERGGQLVNRGGAAQRGTDLGTASVKLATQAL